MIFNILFCPAFSTVEFFKRQYVEKIHIIILPFNIKLSISESNKNTQYFF